MINYFDNKSGKTNLFLVLTLFKSMIRFIIQITLSGWYLKYHIFKWNHSCHQKLSIVLQILRIYRLRNGQSPVRQESPDRAYFLPYRPIAEALWQSFRCWQAAPEWA